MINKPLSEEPKMKNEKRDHPLLIFIFGPLFLSSYFLFDWLWEKLWFFAIPVLGFFIVAFLSYFILSVTSKNKLGVWVGIAVITIIVISGIASSDFFKSEKILEAKLMDDQSAIYLTLRADHKFEMVSSNIASGETFKGNYKIAGNRIIFLDKHFSNKMIPDTLTIVGNKVILYFNENGIPDTQFARYFDINRNKIKQSP